MLEEVSGRGALGAEAAREPMAVGSLAGVLISPRMLLPLALVLVLAVQLPTLQYFFYNDDYVPFADILKSGSSWRYAVDVLTVQDETPNWRVVPSMFYLAGYRIFGLEPWPFHVVSIVFHVGTCALLYRIMVRATGLQWAGFVAAIVFGLNPTHVFTVGQVTSLNNVQGAFFAVATLWAMLEAMHAPRRFAAWYAGALALFVLAIASNESMAALFPAYALAFLLFDDRRPSPPSPLSPKGRGGGAFPNPLSQRGVGAEIGQRVTRAAVRSAPFVAIGAAALISFKTCGCNEASSAFYGWDNADQLIFIYLGRMLYPIGLEPPTQVETAHRVAAIVLAALMLVVVVRGPAIGRVAVAFLLLALLPYLTVWAFTAQRYTYQSTAGFAMLAPVVLMQARALVRRVDDRVVAAAAAPLLALLVAWYAWQTFEQEEPFEQETYQWRSFVEDTERLFPDVERGNYVKIVGGPDPVTNVYKQFHVLPSIALLTWGPGVRLSAVPADSPDAAEALAAPQPGLLVARYDERGELVPVYTEPAGQ